LPLSLGLLTAGALVFAAVSARSQTPLATAPAAASTSAAASAIESASATATASASASATPAQPPLLHGADIPSEPSEIPTTKEWEGARKVRSNGPYQSPCSFTVLREWLRMECAHRIGAALVAGEPADVKIWAWGDVIAGDSGVSGSDQRAKPKTLMTMRLRRGDTKIFELFELGWNYSSSWAEPADKLAVMWREGREDPVLIFGR